jgi:hypothetical protein
MYTALGAGRGAGMRCLSAVTLVLMGFAGLAVFATPNASAASSPGVSAADQLAATAAKLTQQSAGTWTTTVYVDTGALCVAPVSFDLLTTTPYSDTADPGPRYVGGNGSPQCDEQAAHPVTEIELTFTPSPALSSVPQSATLALTPAQTALAAGVMPLDITLTLQRQVSAWQYVWIPVFCGLGLAVLLIGLTWGFGVPWPGAGTEPRRFWGIPLYASSAWTFRDSWATNITAAGAVAGTALTATGSISEVLPGLELGRFSLAIAIAGAVTVIAPLFFGLLNYWFSRLDPTTAGVVAIGLTSKAAGEPDTPASPGPASPGPAGPGESVTITVPAGGSVAIHPEPDANHLSGPDTTVDVPAGGGITISPAKTAPGGGYQRVLVLTGGAEIAVAPGNLITVDGARHDVPAGADISFLGQARVTLPGSACVEAPNDMPPSAPASAPARKRRALAMKQARTELAEPGMVLGMPVRQPSKPAARVLTIPRSGQVVAAQMWTMLAASGLTLFGIGAEIGIMAVVLGFELAVAPWYVHWLALIAAIILAVLAVVYGFFAIRTLADSRDGSTMSNVGNSSFTL